MKEISINQKDTNFNEIISSKFYEGKIVKTVIKPEEMVYDLKQKKLIIIVIQVEEDDFERIIKCNCAKKEDIFSLNLKREISAQDYQSFDENANYF
jgi:hypothetical protein